MRRRDFISLLGGVALAPRIAVAQQRDQKRRVAILMGGLKLDDAAGQGEVAALEAGLKELGWKPGEISRSIITGRAPSSMPCRPPPKPS